MAKSPKERLDKLLVERGIVLTRAKAQAHIMAGDVLVDGAKASKAGELVSVSAEIELTQPLPYVSRGGYKLVGALEKFGIDPTGRTCADVGACTGGFTDVLLQRGAKRVYAIDVGYGQLDWKLRQDERVVVIERTNARYLDSLDESADLVVIDVSFISLKLILPAVQKWLAPRFDIVALIKPQFEAGKEQVGKGGIIKDTTVHQAVVADLLQWSRDHQLYPQAWTRSPILGMEGNTEFLVWLSDNSSAEAIEK